jgi:hypothetical protein
MKLDRDTFEVGCAHDRGEHVPIADRRFDRQQASPR